MLPPIKKRYGKRRKYLVEDEVKALIAAAKSVGKFGHRDSTMILLAWRHGLRCTELVGLQWDQVHLKRAEGEMEMRRVKHGKPAWHPMTKAEIAAIKKLPSARSRKGLVFTSRDGTRLGEQSFFRIVQRAGELAGLDFQCHPHMLRHACGYHLAAKGKDTRRIQEYLGHRNIRHTETYTELAPHSFDGSFED
jgi:site-specific recombinase XerD